MKRTSKAYSKEGESFYRFLNGVAIMTGEGSIDLEDGKSEVYAAIVHDGSGFTPGAAIFVQQGFGSEDEAIQAAYEILEEYFREDSTYMKDIEADVKKSFMQENDLSEKDFQDMIGSSYPGEWDELRDEFWMEVDTWAFEAFDGAAWKLDAREAAEIIHLNSSAAEVIEISGEEGFGAIKVEVFNYHGTDDDPRMVYLEADADDIDRHNKYYVFEKRKNWRWETHGSTAYAEMLYDPDLINDLQQEGYTLDLRHFDLEQAEREHAKRMEKYEQDKRDLQED